MDEPFPAFGRIVSYSFNSILFMDQERVLEKVASMHSENTAEIPRYCPTCKKDLSVFDRFGACKHI